jgi:hypothetical protein
MKFSLWIKRDVGYAMAESITGCDCEKAGCAWWQKWGEKPEQGECAVLSTAKALIEFHNQGVVVKNQY